VRLDAPNLRYSWEGALHGVACREETAGDLRVVLPSPGKLDHLPLSRAQTDPSVRGHGRELLVGQERCEETHSRPGLRRWSWGTVPLSLNGAGS